MLELCVCCITLFFFKQKTAYEMRISDWSSDVCSSDLDHRQHHPRPGRKDRGQRDAERKRRRRGDLALAADRALLAPRGDMMPEMGMRQQPGLEPRRRAREAEGEIGRASCRERVCQYV